MGLATWLDVSPKSTYPRLRRPSQGLQRCTMDLQASPRHFYSWYGFTRPLWLANPDLSQSHSDWLVFLPVRHLVALSRSKTIPPARIDSLNFREVPVLAASFERDS